MCNGLVVIGPQPEELGSVKLCVVASSTSADDPLASCSLSPPTISLSGLLQECGSSVGTSTGKYSTWHLGLICSTTPLGLKSGISRK